MQTESKFRSNDRSFWSFLNGVTTVCGIFCMTLGWWLFDNAWMSIAGMYMTMYSVHSQELMNAESVKKNTDWD